MKSECLLIVIGTDFCINRKKNEHFRQQLLSPSSRSFILQKNQFDKLASEAKILENEINGSVASFEKKKNMTCYTVPVNRNSIELVISTDINQL